MAPHVIYLAGGCFWGTEHFMQLVKGVTDTEVGYANSNVPNPSYKLVCSGTTDAAETVKVTFDPAVVSLEYLLKLFFLTIDPTSVNRQGNDVGTQYRTGIYYTDAADLPAIRTALNKIATQFSEPIAVEVMPIENFYPAEDYHQDYLIKNPTGYCHIHPELFKMLKSQQ